MNALLHPRRAAPLLAAALLVSAAGCFSSTAARQEANRLANATLLAHSSNLDVVAPTDQPIYGVGRDVGGGGGQFIYRVDYATGAELFLTRKQVTYQGAPIATSVLGLARHPVQAPNGNQGILTVIEPGSANPCGGGTAFYSVNLSAGAAAKLGTAVNYHAIADIEFNPVDQKLYGIYQDVLVRVDGFGQACNTSGNGVPATVVQLGKLTAVGAGPYGIAFSITGECHLVSAKDHRRAILVPPATPLLVNGQLGALPLKPASLVVDPSADLGSSIEVGACMSGPHFVFATGHFPLPPSPSSSTYARRFYHWRLPAWESKGPHVLVDYTSTPTSGELPKFSQTSPHPTPPPLTLAAIRAVGQSGEVGPSDAHF